MNNQNLVICENKILYEIFSEIKDYLKFELQFLSKKEISKIVSKNKKNYNRLIKVNKKIKHEKLFRNDNKYNFLIPIKYNFKQRILGKGSCIFIHLTQNYKPTAGCIALKEKDFLILLRIINKKSKIII